MVPPEPVTLQLPSLRLFHHTPVPFFKLFLSHFPSICAFTLPTKFSYARMLDGIWSSGTWVGWGIEAREAPIRVTGPNAPPTHVNGLGGGQHFEIRCVDGTSNPYLELAALLGVGARGISENAKLKVKGVDMADVEKTIAEMSEVERKRNGIGGERLLLTLQDARVRLSQDKAVRNPVGNEFVDKYLSVNETMEKLFVAETEEATMTKLVEYF